MMSFERIVGVMGWKALVAQLYSSILPKKLDISKNKWSKSLPMSGENRVHKRHLKTHLEKKTNHCHKPLEVSKNLSLT
jgi:hypothetical protein